MRVRLITDLTRYDRRLTAGQEGNTCGPTDIWARGSDRFTGVAFDCGASRDILWESLEIIDSKFVAQKKREEAALGKARSITVEMGPRGGFRHIRYEVKVAGRWAVREIYNRHEAVAVLGRMVQQGCTDPGIVECMAVGLEVSWGKRAKPQRRKRAPEVEGPADGECTLQWAAGLLLEGYARTQERKKQQ